MDEATLARINAERRARRSVAVITDLGSAQSRVVTADAFAGDEMAPALARARQTGRPVRATAPAGAELFVNVYAPPPRIYGVGAVHIAHALSQLAGIAGYDITIVDPREAFASAERFPGVTLAAAWPQDYFSPEMLDAHTAMVAMSHDPRIDDPALQAAAAGNCFYIGALGSRKTHAARVERLSSAGLSAQAIARIEAPVGLDIHAATPPEIAVAILGSVIRAHRGRGRDGE